MAKFSIARIPYYITVIVFMVLVALVSFWNNATAVGVESDLYLGAMAVAGALALLSIYYLLTAQSGDNDEVGLEVAGVGFDKKFYYFGVLGISAWRAVAGYQLNHTGVGVQSIYGVIWLFASVAVALFTYANYRSYTAKKS